MTTEAAFKAGVDIWGYPKYITPIETRFTDAGASARLGDELTLSVGPLRGPSMKLPVVTYTAREGRRLRTVIEVEDKVRWGAGLSARISLLGDGPTAQSARALGLDRAPAIAAFHTNRFRATLPAGVDRGPADRDR